MQPARRRTKGKRAQSRGGSAQSQGSAQSRGGSAQSRGGSAQSKDQHKFEGSTDCVYLAFYKPFGVISQFSSGYMSDKPTLSAFGFPRSVYPVGRLDSDSEGLLVLSDDPAINDALLNPKRAHTRTYLVQVEGIPDGNALQQLRDGIVLDGSVTLPARAELLDYEPELPPRDPPIRFRKSIPAVWIALTLTEGKNRQVRRMTAAVGYPTLRLVRWAIGSLTLSNLDLSTGEWKHISTTQINDLFSSDSPPLPEQMRQ